MQVLRKEVKHDQIGAMLATRILKIQKAGPDRTLSDVTLTAYQELLGEALALNVEMAQDSYRIDCLEELLWSPMCGNGLALLPQVGSESHDRGVSLVDLGNENGENLGDELTAAHNTLRMTLDDVCGCIAHAFPKGNG